MSLNTDQLRELQSPFYRVAVKAIVFDDQQRILVVANKHGQFEIPGGGWEHDESFEACVHREIKEELGVGVNSISPIWFTFRGKSSRGWYALRIVVRAELDSLDFKLNDGMTATRFVTKEELLNLHPMGSTDGSIKEYVDVIWEGK